jgi:hypothetical protein
MSEIRGREVLKVRALAGEFDYAKESKPGLAGDKYRRFTYGGKAFVANVKDSFCSAFDNGKVYSLDIDVVDDKASLVGFTTIEQEINMAKTEVQLATFTVENYVAGKLVNPAELIALG